MAKPKNRTDKDEQRLRETFGANVRELRKQAEWSQSDLAEKLDVTLDMIGRLERGKVGASFKTIARLSNLFDVPEYLFFGNGLMPTFKGPRGRILNSINVSLSKMTDADLEKAKKLLEVLAA